MSVPNFWDDNDAAQQVIGEVNQLKENVEKIATLEEQYEDLQVMFELAMEENDESMLSDLAKGVKSLSKSFSDFELQLLLSGPYDKNNAILERPHGLSAYF